jgi:hypothetical protein
MTTIPALRTRRNKLKGKLYYCIALILLLSAVLIAGCAQSSTGCIPVIIENKHTTSSPNVMSLILTINGVDYQYYNPKLDTFAQIETNKTYLVQFDPMLSGRPDVELCGAAP